MFSRLALGLSVLVSIRIYRFHLHFEDLYMGVQVLCRPPDVGPPTRQQLCTAKRACAVQNGADLVQPVKHDLITVSILIFKECYYQNERDSILYLVCSMVLKCVDHFRVHGSV